jgi:hypothetical protein
MKAGEYTTRGQNAPPYPLGVCEWASTRVGARGGRGALEIAAQQEKLTSTNDLVNSKRGRGAGGEVLPAGLEVKTEAFFGSVLMQCCWADANFAKGLQHSLVGSFDFLVQFGHSLFNVLARVRDLIRGLGFQPGCPV